MKTTKRLGRSRGKTGVSICLVPGSQEAVYMPLRKASASVCSSMNSPLSHLVLEVVIGPSPLRFMLAAAPLLVGFLCKPPPSPIKLFAGPRLRGILVSCWYFDGNSSKNKQENKHTSRPLSPMLCELALLLGLWDGLHCGPLKKMFKS